MYKNILVPIDPGHEDRHQAAYEMAAHLVSEGGRITAVTAIEPIPAYAGFGGLAPQLEETMKSNVTQALANFSEGRAVATEILHGVPGTEIVEYAKKNNVDCIIVASHEPGFGDFLIGSTAARVVRHAPCSVHVLR